jgi:hypothetical protein
MQTIGYHTLEDRGNYIPIEETGPKPCSHSKAWLGHGYYFWDSNIYWAHDWGRNYAKYMIFEGEIEIDENTYDLLGNISHKLEFAEMSYDLKRKNNLKPEANVIVAQVIEYIKKFVGFDYNSIRAADYPERTSIISFGGKRGEFMYLNERAQICLINKNNLSLPSFKVIHPEEYKE